MKDRHHCRKRGRFGPLTALFLWSTLLLFLSGFTFSTLHLFFTGGFHPKLISSWHTSSKMEVVSGVSPVAPAISVRETVSLPDQSLVFLKYPASVPLFTKGDISCVYYSPNSSIPQLESSSIDVDDQYQDSQIVRCSLPQPGTAVSLRLKSLGDLPPGPAFKWDRLAYEAMIDRDNTTIVWVKGLNLRPGRLSNASRFECVYGWDFTRTKFLLRSAVVYVAQEVVRCKTPLSILSKNYPTRAALGSSSIRVSVRVIGRGILPTIACPEKRMKPDASPKKQHQMCVCTMLRNQARFLREWIIYHSRIGIERWYIYDNNSNDEIENVIESLAGKHGVNITRHTWPWIKTQEAGFAHCAMRARDSCEWVGFIDVDEFLHLPLGLSLDSVLNNRSRPSEVAELRTSCHSFGPSGLKSVPLRGVMVGYTCRLGSPERHKSIVRPEALSPTLINVVHHFRLRDGFEHMNVDRNLMVVNHYKYQVWQVFKEKFYRRVATYVSDWQQDQNVGSKDRAPGLGTRAVEPPDWSTRFCEVTDTGLRDRVLETFVDQSTGLLPWQDIRSGEEDGDLVLQNRIRRRQSRVTL